MIYDEDIKFVRTVLPHHYDVSAAPDKKGITCKSKTEAGISERNGDWEIIFKAFKKYFGTRFSEVFHYTCSNHLRFIIFIKNS